LNELDSKGFRAALLMFAVLLLLPFSRWSGLPVLLMLVAGIIVLASQWRALAGDNEFRLLIGLWLCYWLPQLISCLDAVNLEESWRTTLAALRFPLVGAYVIVNLANDAARRLLWQLATGLVIFWSLDASLQMLMGFNLLGMPLSDDRLNGVFGATNIKLGPVLAVLAPLALEYARRHWPRALLPTIYLLILALVITIGTRSAWFMYLLVTIGYLFLYARRQTRRWVKATALVMILIAGVGVSAYQVSPKLQQRIDRSLLLLQGDSTAVNYALSNRLPIWRTAVNMVLQHPFNGVGVRGFRHAYGEHAGSDDPWVDFPGDTGAHHAHQMLLEVATETGVPGLVGLLWALVLAWRHWQSLERPQRATALPFAIALVVMLFPINTHLAFYSTFWSLLFWWLIIAYCASSGSRVWEQ
jgi:O-antigen ligase